MTTTNYIPVKAILFDLASMIDDKYWNEAIVYENAVRGFMKLKFDDMYEDEVSTIQIEDHKGQLPLDLKYLTQVIYSDNSQWFPMQITSSPFFMSQCEDTLKTYVNCKHSFSVDSSLIITTTLASGEIKISYKRFKKDADGEILMPDDEDVKDAIFAYVMYMYWLAKDSMMEEGASARMREWRSIFNMASTKANGNLNLPDLNALENMKNSHNRFVPRHNQFAHLFTKLGNSEYAKL